MVNRLKSFIFILALSVSVFSGTPFQGGDMKMKEGVCPMKCCKKKAKASEPKQSDNAKYLCRVLICSQNMPTHTTTTVQFNLAPVIIASEKVSLFKIIFSTTPKEESKPVFESILSKRQSLPKYIQNQRILI